MEATPLAESLVDPTGGGPRACHAPGKRGTPSGASARRGADMPPAAIALVHRDEVPED